MINLINVLASIVYFLGPLLHFFLYFLLVDDVDVVLVLIGRPGSFDRFFVGMDALGTAECDIWLGSHVCLYVSLYYNYH